MFERINASVDKKGDAVKSVSIKVKINTPGKAGPWAVTDIQCQEGSSATEYVEHIAEMERVKQRRIVYRTIEVEKGASILILDVGTFKLEPVQLPPTLLDAKYIIDIQTFLEIQK